MARHRPRRLWVPLVAGLALAAALTPAQAQAHARPAVAAVLHVSPSGTGSACTTADPCSLGTAQQQIRSLAPAMTADLQVDLAGGTYRLTGPLQFTAADSGTGGHRVVWQAEPGAHPVLSGGRRITGWQLTDAARGLWTAPVPASVQTRQLYADGQRIPVAQGPAPIALTRAPGGYTAAGDAYSHWRNPSGLEFVYTGGNGAWTESRCRVSTASGTRITMRQPCWDNVTNRPMPPAQSPFFFPNLPSDAVPTRIENAYELLHPGQWYLDTTQHTVSYIPPAGTDPNQADIEAPVLQTLVSGQGTLDAPVHDITLSGITFAYATWLDPSGDDGFSEIQANVRITGPQGLQPQGTCTFTQPAGTCPFGANAQDPAAVTWRGAHDVTVQNGDFTHLGAGGLAFAYGSRNDVVDGNEFSDLSGNGVTLGSTGDPHPSDVGADDREINTGTLIENNYIHDIGAEYPGADGILLFYSRHTTVTHNEIVDVPWDGIDSGANAGHLDTADHPDLTTNINADNAITDNLVHNFHRVLSDGGAIYLEGHQGATLLNADGSVDEEGSFAHGTMVAGNVVYNDLHSGLTLYNDIGSQWVTWTRNIEFNNSAGNGGCAPVGHLRFTGNLHADQIGVYPCSPAAVDMQYSGNTQLPLRPGPADMPSDILGNAGLQSAYWPLATAAGPRVDAVSPRQGPVAAPTGALITGSGFTAGSTVSFGGVPAAQTTVLSPSFIVAQAPAGASLAEATVTTSAGSYTGPSGLPLTSVTADSMDDEAFWNTSFYPYNAVDDNTGTFWSSAGTAMPHWIEIRFSHPVTLGKVVVQVRNFGDMTLKDLTLSASSGGGPLQQAAAVTGNTSPDATFTLSAPVTADTVRVTVNSETYSGSPRANADIGQIEFYDGQGRRLGH